MHSTSQRKQSSTEHMCGLTYLSTGVFPAPTTVTAGHNKTIDSQVSTYLLISTYTTGQDKLAWMYCMLLKTVKTFD